MKCKDNTSLYLLNGLSFQKRHKGHLFVTAETCEKNEQQNNATKNMFTQKYISFFKRTFVHFLRQTQKNNKKIIKYIKHSAFSLHLKSQI